MSKLNQNQLDTQMSTNPAVFTMSTQLANKTYQKGVPANFWKIKLKEIANRKKRANQGTIDPQRRIIRLLEKEMLQSGQVDTGKAGERRIYEEDVNIAPGNGRRLQRQVTIEIDQVEGYIFSSEERLREPEVEAPRVQPVALKEAKIVAEAKNQPKDNHTHE